VHPEPSVITHDDVSRSISVTAAIKGRDASAVSADVRAKVATIAMPREFSARVLGDATAKQDAFRWTAGLVAGVVLVAFLALQALTRNWRRAAVLLGLPLAGGAGAVATAPLAGGITTAGALTGLAAVVALSLRGAVVTEAELAGDIDHDGTTDLLATVLQRRSVGVLTTAIAAAALLLPAAVLGNRPGLEFLHPLAVSALGGLVTSCVVLLFLLPPLLQRARDARRAPREAEAVVAAAPAPADVVGTKQSRTPVAPRHPADDMVSPATTHRLGDEGNES
jgi:Cu/Ag efflux pump CusA